MKTLLIALSAVIVSGCAAQLAPGANRLDISNVDYANAKNFKEASDCSHRILFFGPFGRSDFVEAVKKANISKVTSIDYTFQEYLVYAKSCVNVYGE